MLAIDDQFAEELRGLGPLGIAAIAVILAGNFLFLPLSAILALAWAQASRTPWSELGFVRPNSWTLTIAGGTVIGVAFKLVMKAIVMPLLGADPVNQAYHYLAGNTRALPGALFLMIVVAGFGEELVYRGFLFERLRKLLGVSSLARLSTLLFTSALFALGHYAEQGLAGSEQAMISGLVLGSIFAYSGKLWLPMVIHAAFDLTALAIIYWDLEVTVAHSVFR